MQVKLEPSEQQFDLPVDFITDIETDFREHLFGNSSVSNNSDFSESSSDDDQLSVTLNNNNQPFNFELFAKNVCTDSSNQWEHASSSSSSPGGSFDQTPSDQTFSEFDFSQNSFGSDIDVEIGNCSPQDFIINSHDVKEEYSNSYESFSEALSSTSPNHIWDILCSNDVKPNIKVLETPPVTPPENNRFLIDSPPTSPSEIASNGGSPIPATCIQQSPRAIITMAPLSAKPPDSSPPRKKIALAPKIPFKVVTTITANENNLNPNVPRTIRVQPKVSTTVNTPTVTLTSSAGPKLNINRTGIKFNNTKQQLIRKPVVISSSQTQQHSTTVQSPIAIPSTINVSTCRVVPEHTTTRLPPIAPAVNPSLKNSSLSELRAMKRQQRMIKNRESASLSRKRKKEYLQGLEDKVRELDTENSRLRAENDKLRRRVTSLENEKVIMRSARFPIKRSSTALLGFAFLILFNVSPLWNIFQREPSEPFLSEKWNTKKDFGSEIIKPSDVSNQFPHRSLLSFSPIEDMEGIEKIGGSLERNLSSICPLSFNSTESLRIDNELRDWFDSSSKDWPVKPSKKANKSHSRFYPRANEEDSIKNNSENKTVEKKALAAPLTSVISSAAYQYLYNSEKEAPSLHPNRLPQEQTFSKEATSIGGNLQSLLESIERRNDTYYVVSLTAEHLLLPASAHNTSMRPKMSLLVPTPKTWNDDHNQIGLMQIDCEVTHTKVIRWTRRTEEVSVPSVPSKGASSFMETPVNNTNSESLRKEKPKRRKRKVF